MTLDRLADAAAWRADIAPKGQRSTRRRIARLTRAAALLPGTPASKAALAAALETAR